MNIADCWVIVELGKTITEARCTILEIANVLKIVISLQGLDF